MEGDRAQAHTYNYSALSDTIIKCIRGDDAHNWTFSAFDHEEFYSFTCDDPPDGSGNFSIGSEPVFRLSKFDPTLGALNKITVNANFDYTITSNIEVIDMLDYEVPDHSASYRVDSDGGDGDRDHVYVRYRKGQTSFFMTNEFFNPSASCSGGEEPCANFETSLRAVFTRQ